MELTFKLASEILMVKIQGEMGHNVTFANEFTHFQTFVPIDLLILDKAGILKEFPDLEGKPDIEIRSEAIIRFKKYIKTLKSDKEVMDYVIFELGKYGWQLIKTRREGFRDVKVKAR